MAFSSFEELAKSRAEWYAVSEQNGFSEGIERLLTKLYPDKAHFIFELLQNAEDAQATKVEFRLKSGELVFIHNGRRLFDLRDVESITSIADSTKREDGTSIGKFGIGFKAVFSYTETPIIHSGEWHFKISHMVVPEWHDDGSERVEEGQTLFRFPFNKKQKDHAKAYSEILEGLKSFDSETILFLRNISQVYVSYADKELIITKSEKDHCVELVKLQEDCSESHRRYLLFSKVIDEMRLEDGTTARSLPIGIAYRLEEKSCNTSARLSDRYEIAPVARRNVYVFFPAEKETSGLRFCLNAPFASTAARDSICNNRDNANLLEKVADLQVESLEYLRETGFLTVDFLGILPNSKDFIGSLYECFHSKLVEAFRYSSFTPKKCGGHAPASLLRRGPAVVSDLFDDSDLRVLTGDETASWMKNANQVHSETDRFLDDLGVRDWGAKDLIALLCDSQTSLGIIRQVLDRKNNGRLAEIYGLIEGYLSHEDDSDGLVEMLRKVPMFRTSDGSFASAAAGLFISGSVFLPRDEVGGVKFVHSGILVEARSERIRSAASRFFSHLGIELCSESAMMKLFVDQYWKTKRNLTEDESVARLKTLVRLVAQGTIEPSVVLRFPVINNEGKYVEISKTFVDEPYAPTGLACYVLLLKEVGITQLSGVYVRRLSEDELRHLVEKADSMGIKKKLWLVDSPIRKNPRCSELWDFSRRTTFNEYQSDYDIPGLDVFAKSPSLDQAKLIWEFVLSRQGRHLKAEYRANASDPGRSVPAKFLQTLERTAWIPVDGQIGLVKPENATLEGLPRDWRCPKEGYSHPALLAMNFGRKTRQQKEKREHQDRFARENGFANASEIETLKKMKELCETQGLSPEKVLERLLGEHNPAPPVLKEKERPKRSTSDVNGRMSKATSRFQKAATQTYIEVGRSVHVGSAKTRDAAREYLRGEYETDGKMFCQLCQSSMPFRGRDGKGYFVATQVFTHMKKDIEEQFLSLCPTCRAKYDEWVRCSSGRSADLRAKIVAHNPVQNEEFVEIPLPGKSEGDVKSPLSGRSLYFTGTHFIDLRQAVIEDGRVGTNQGEQGSPVELRIPPPPFIDWYRQYDPSASEMLSRVKSAADSLNACLRQGGPGAKQNAGFWTVHLNGECNKILAFWDEYHYKHPDGESLEVARNSLMRITSSSSW